MTRVYRSAAPARPPLPDLGEKVLDVMCHGVMITDADVSIIYVNQAFTELTGYSAREVLGKSPRIISSGRHGVDFYEKMWRAILGTGSWQGEIWNRRKNGELYLEWLSITRIKDDEGTVSHYVGVFSDITQKKEWEERLHRLSYHDSLTGLPNRLLCQDRMGQALARARRSRKKLAVIYVDLDRFKEVNDSLGHPAGDLVLRKTAGRLTACLREMDTVGRLGGDEFLVLLPDIDAEADAVAVALKILWNLSEPFDLEGERRLLGASVGIAFFPTDGHDLETLLRNADTAMYRAKAKGGNRCESFSARDDMC